MRGPGPRIHVLECRIEARGISVADAPAVRGHDDRSARGMCDKSPGFTCGSLVSHSIVQAHFPAHRHVARYPANAALVRHPAQLVLDCRARPHIETSPDFACRRRIVLANGNEVPQFFQIGLGHDFAEPGSPWKPAMKGGPLAEGQGEQTGTQQENAGDGHCQESIGCKFFTHGAYPTSARGNGSGAPCEIVSADFSHPCPAMPAVKPAIFAVEQGEMFPHRSHPVV